MTAALLLGVVALVALNGLFVAAEFALVRARRTRVEQLAEEGRRSAALVLIQLDRIDVYLSACQLGITMASLGIGFLGEPAIASLLEEPLGSFLSHGVSVALSIAIAYLIVTALHITVGEQVPKIYAITHPEPTARRVARPLEWFRVASRPLTWGLNSVSNALLRLIGTDPRAEFHEGSSAEELRLLIVESAGGGRIDRGEARMLSGVFHLHEQEARQVMTPFTSVVTVAEDDPVEAALRRCIESGHTRLVVTEADAPDQVTGMVHSNSLARILLRDGPQAPIAAAIKPTLFFPETKPLDDLLTDLQRERLTLAVVADEYGRPVGIVTVEDVVEEVVGEIVDETDPVTREVRRLANGDWYVRGDVSLGDLADFGVELPAESDSFNSVGGLVFHELGRVPKLGDLVRVGDYSIRVESVRGTRIGAVRVHRHGRGDKGEPPEG